MHVTGGELGEAIPLSPIIWRLPISATQYVVLLYLANLGVLRPGQAYPGLVGVDDDLLLQLICCAKLYIQAELWAQVSSDLVGTD